MKTYKLGELITQRREKNNETGLPIRGVSREGLIPPKQIDADTSIYNVFYLRDFIFNPARMELNSIAFNDKYEKAICSSLYEVFYVHREDIVLPEYLKLIVKQDWFTRYCEFLGQGSAREYCRFANISEINIELPDIEMQKKAVYCDKVINERIALKRRINDNLSQTGTAIIRKNVGYAALINKTQAEINALSLQKGWCIKTISDYCADTKSGSTPSRSDNRYWIDGTIPWLKSGEVHNNITIGTEENITPLALKETSVKLLPPDTVLMAMYGVTAGEVGYLSISATTNQAICGMICNSKPEAAYLFFALIQSQEEASRLSNGGAQDNLSKNFIDGINIIVPDIQSINSFHLDDLVEQITLNTREIIILEDMRDTLLATISSR